MSNMNNMNNINKEIIKTIKSINDLKRNKRNHEKKSRKWYFTLLHLIYIIILISLFVLFSNNYIKSWKHDLEKVFDGYAESLIYPSWTLNRNLIDMLLKAMIKKDDIISIVVYYDGGEKLGSIENEEKLTFLHSALGLKTKFKEYRLEYQGFYCGRVIFEYSYYGVVRFLFIISHIFILLYIFFYMLIKNFEKNERLKSLVNELNDANTELEITLSELEETQQRVINSEKMAALGKLMVNIAHDVNTPTGIIYSSLTDLKGKVNSIYEHLNSEELTEEELRGFLSVSSEFIEIMLRNAQRIKELVQSLKRVAVNEVTETFATVNIKDILKDVLNALHPKLRKTKINVNVDVPDNLIVHTVPGAWAQILINLIDNAIVHAFEYDNPGEISIKFEKRDEKIAMTFSDNGKGMDEETKIRAFEPFYTTDAASGSGLGLSIVYQITVDLLKGDIHLESQKDSGTTIKILAPIIEQKPGDESMKI